MTPDKGNNTKISLKMMAIVVTIMVGIFTLWTLYNSALNAKIENSPKIIKMEADQKSFQKETGDRLERMEKTLDGIALDLKELKNKTERKK